MKFVIVLNLTILLVASTTADINNSGSRYVSNKKRSNNVAYTYPATSYNVPVRSISTSSSSLSVAGQSPSVSFIETGLSAYRKPYQKPSYYGAVHGTYPSGASNNYIQPINSGLADNVYNSPAFTYTRTAYSAPTNSYSKPVSGFTKSYHKPVYSSPALGNPRAYISSPHPASPPSNNYALPLYSNPAAKAYNIPGPFYTPSSAYSAPAKNYPQPTYPVNAAKTCNAPGPALSYIQPLTVVPPQNYINKSPAVHPQSFTNISTLYDNFNIKENTTILYNGTVFQGPYHFQPTYEHINFGNIGFVNHGTNGTQALAHDTLGVGVFGNSSQPINATALELFLTQIQHFVNKTTSSAIVT